MNARRARAILDHTGPILRGQKRTFTAMDPALQKSGSATIARPDSRPCFNNDRLEEARPENESWREKMIILMDHHEKLSQAARFADSDSSRGRPNFWWPMYPSPPLHTAQPPPPLTAPRSINKSPNRDQTRDLPGRIPATSEPLGFTSPLNTSRRGTKAVPSVSLEDFPDSCEDFGELVDLLGASMDSASDLALYQVEPLEIPVDQSPFPGIEFGADARLWRGRHDFGTSCSETRIANGSDEVAKRNVPLTLNVII